MYQVLSKLSGLELWPVGGGVEICPISLHLPLAYTTDRLVLPYKLTECAKNSSLL